MKDKVYYINLTETEKALLLVTRLVKYFGDNGFGQAYLVAVSGTDMFFRRNPNPDIYENPFRITNSRLILTDFDFSDIGNIKTFNDSTTHRILVGEGNKTACGKHFKLHGFSTKEHPVWTLQFTTDTSLVTCESCILAGEWRDIAHTEPVNTNPEKIH